MPTSVTPERHPEGRISLEIRGHLLLMGIDRPEKYNGFTPKMFTELADAYAQLEENSELRVGVLFAHGKHFTAGLDLPKFSAAMASGEPILPTNGIDPFALRGTPRAKPIVSAVHGICFTAGIELMLATEIVIAANDTRFAQMEVGRGIMATGGATVRMVQRGGWGNAMKVLLTGAEFSAQEALHYQFVQQVLPMEDVLPRAIELAELIARQAPLAVQATLKSARTYVLEGQDAAVADFTDAMQTLATTADAREGVQSFIEKRPPVFRGR